MPISTSRPRRHTTLSKISYRDESTDEEFSAATPTRSSQRLEVKARHQIHPDTVVNILEEHSEDIPKHDPIEVRLPCRSQPSHRFQNESRNENLDSISDDKAATRRPRARSHKKPLLKHHPSHKQRRPLDPCSLNRGPFDSFKRRKTNHQTAGGGEKTTIPAIQAIPPGKVPPWQTLPYQILLCILQDASYPLYENASHDTGSTGWLIRVSTLSKSFHDAAISALLYSPPLLPAERAHGLVQLLDADQKKLSTPYCTKVKRLDVEVRNLLTKKSGIDLVQLVKQTPLLQSIYLYHNYDRVGAVSWAQPSATRGRSWSYPMELFDALDVKEIRLSDWSWNGRFPDTKMVLDRMVVLHSRNCLKDLRSLSMINLAAHGDLESEENVLARKKLSASVEALSNLQHLKFENCTLVDREVLTSLPSDLRSLSITNCIGFGSEDFRIYLVHHGFYLKDLSLVGNQALDFGFAEDFETLCPHLQFFKMDFTYTDPSAFHDVVPHFEDVFPNSIMPTWPRSLREITIENLRNLDVAGAENFFKSLIHVALELKDLRKLSVGVLLHDDGWRERAQLRQKWMPEVEDMFLRKTPPPEPFFLSVLRRRSDKTQHPRISDPNCVATMTTTTQIKRKSTRIANQREAEDTLSDAMDLDRLHSSTSKKGNRENAGGETHLNTKKQAMCDKVILHVDGQRPATEQFKEADFLDDERSGDEDWNGRD